MSEPTPGSVIAKLFALLRKQAQAGLAMTPEAHVVDNLSMMRPWFEETLRLLDAAEKELKDVKP